MGRLTNPLTARAVRRMLSLSPEGDSKVQPSGSTEEASLGLTRASCLAGSRPSAAAIPAQRRLAETNNSDNAVRVRENADDSGRPPAHRSPPRRSRRRCVQEACRCLPASAHTRRFVHLPESAMFRSRRTKRCVRCGSKRDVQTVTYVRGYEKRTESWCQPCRRARLIRRDPDTAGTGAPSPATTSADFWSAAPTDARPAQRLVEAERHGSPTGG